MLHELQYIELEQVSTRNTTLSCITLAGFVPLQISNTLHMMFNVPLRGQRPQSNLHQIPPHNVITPDYEDEPLYVARPPQPSSEVSPEQLQEFILEALAFKSMNERQEEVAEAHQQTFGWIFGDSAPSERLGNGSPGHNFLHWLRNKSVESSGIYWIGGKAG